MMTPYRSRIAALLIAPWSVCVAVAQVPNESRELPRFEISFDGSGLSSPYTGRVYVMLAESNRREPRIIAHRWMNPTPVFAIDVTAWDPTRPVIIDRNTPHQRIGMADLPRKTFYVQAVARRDLDFPKAGVGTGDLYSKVVELDLTGDVADAVKLRLDQAAIERPFTQSERIKYVEIISPLLSKFHGRQMKMRAGVALPKDWDVNGSQRYPILYRIPGFGGSHRSIAYVPRMGHTDLIDRMIVVIPDPTCYRGHHVFADSENNGPVGRALVEELIPFIEKKFHGAQSPTHRYVTGASSGGWSALWLQITYPDVFGGCWADVPDPVDFRDFQRVNLYQPGVNMYVDETGAKRPLMRQRDRVLITYEDFVGAEEVLGLGGQIHSFEAVFSRRGTGGRPESLFDRKTGAVNNAVARSWERYDIRLILERNWKTLGPKLNGKLHIYAGEFDNFYLEGAVRLLKESLTKLGSDAEVEIVAGAGHGTMWGPRQRPMLQTIVDNYRREFDPQYQEVETEPK